MIVAEPCDRCGRFVELQYVSNDVDGLQTCEPCVALVFTPRQLVDALSEVGLPAVFENTGGGVYAVVADVVSHPTGVVGCVVIGTGEWSAYDLDTPELAVSMSGETELAPGRGWENVPFPSANLEGEWRIDVMTVEDVVTYAVEIAETVRAAWQAGR